MARGRIGALSRATYFPGTGDQLQNSAAGVVFECVRSNVYRESEDAEVAYGLLRGKEAGSDEVLYLPIDVTQKNWLDGVDTIRRPIPGSESSYRTYVFLEETGTWRQVRE
jgi:hypothetical protein